MCVCVCVCVCVSTCVRACVCVGGGGVLLTHCASYDVRVCV